jgi:hypothetical protein
MLLLEMLALLEGLDPRCNLQALLHGSGQDCPAAPQMSPFQSQGCWQFEAIAAAADLVLSDAPLLRGPGCPVQAPLLGPQQGLGEQTVGGVAACPQDLQLHSLGQGLDQVCVGRWLSPQVHLPLPMHHDPAVAVQPPHTHCWSILLMLLVWSPAVT